MRASDCTFTSFPETLMHRSIIAVGGMRRLAGAALLSLFLPGLLAAQGATLRGTVTAAQTHVPVQGARVALESPARIAQTDAAGRYTLRDLPAGKYEVLVTALGNKPVRRMVDVAAGQAATLDVELEAGSLMLSSVIVTATRTPTDANRVASTVNVLSPEQVQTSPARESQDLLREIPGVELPRTSSLVGGTAQIVSIRGVDEGRTAVLFDGIPVNDAWGEWIDWGRVPKGMLDHVEVVEGGTSSLYGNGAMGGVISFFSRPLAPGAVNLLVEGGSRNTRHVFAAAGVPIVGPLTAYVSGDYQDGGGYTLLDPLKRGTIDERSEIIQRNAYVRLNYAPSPKLSAFVTGHLFGDNRRTGTALSYQSRQQGNIDLGVDYGGLGGRLALRAWEGRQDEHQRSSTVRANSSTCAAPSTTARQCEDSSVVADIPSHDAGISAVWTRAMRAGALRLESVSLGGDFRRMTGEYDEVDFNTGCPGVNCGTVSRTIRSGGDQDLSGAFAQVIAAPVRPLRIELSARVDRWENNNGRSVDASAGPTEYADRTKTAFSPRVGARYELFDGLSVHGAVYSAFRAPNLAELYRKQISATQITIPNPDLKPETALGREVGLDWQPMDWMQLKGTWYVADYKDFNVPVQISAGPPVTRQRLNVSKSRSKGGEAYIALRPMADLLISGSVNYDDARVVAGPPGTVVGAHINRVPSPKQNVRATYASGMFGTWTAIWRHEGHTTTLQGASLEPYTVVDANVQRAIVHGVTGFVSVENIGDTKYQINLAGTGTNTLLSYGLPRTVRVGLQAYRY
jgi:outer membrane receptor protein involved in Fe transport